jgi:O-antigen/teichoic acid export membrane protein
MIFHGREGKSLIAKNSIVNLIGQLLPMAVGVWTIRYVVRGLGPDGYGILSIAWMMLGYFGIFDLGLSRATVKFVAENLGPDNIHKVPELVWTSLSLLVGIGCIGGLLVAAWIPFAVRHFFKLPPSFVPEATTGLLIISASMPVMLANDALRGVLEATQRFDLVNYVKVPSSVLFYLSAAVATWMGSHIPIIILILVMIRLLSSLVYLVLCIRVIPQLRNLSLSKAAIRPLASFGGWIMVSNITGPILGYMERTLIASVLSIGMLTYYSVPFDLVGKILVFPSSLAPTLFPYFSYHGGKKGNAVLEVTSRAVKYLLLIMTPITAILVCFASDILTLWMGPALASQSTVVLQLLAIALFLNAFAYIPYSSVQALGRPDLKAFLDLLMLPVYGLSCWLLMRKMGINGAAMAKLLSGVLDTGALFAFAWRLKAFSLRDCLSGPLLRAVGSSAALAAVLWFIKSLHEPWIISAVLVAVCCICYMAAVWIGSIEVEERVVIKTLSRRLFDRIWASAA